MVALDRKQGVSGTLISRERHLETQKFTLLNRYDIFESGCSGAFVAYWPRRDDSSVRGTFELKCRGDVRLLRGREDCTPKSKKGRALLAILAAEHRPLTRTKIIDLLWSDRQEEQARASLRTLLADLRAQFGDGFNQLLTVDRERLALSKSVRNDINCGSAGLHSGELFEGLDHLDPELDEWLRLERGRHSGASTPNFGVVSRGGVDPVKLWGAAAAITGLLAIFAMLVLR